MSDGPSLSLAEPESDPDKGPAAALALPDDGEDRPLKSAPLLRELQDLIGHPVLALFAPRLDYDVVAPVGECLERIGSQARLSLLVESRGGDADTAHTLASLIGDYADELHVYVMSRAGSAATLLAFHAAVLWMGPNSALGPIDPQMRFPGAELWPHLPPDERPSQDVWLPTRVLHDFLEFVGVIPGRHKRPPIEPVARENWLSTIGPVRLGLHERAEKISRLYAYDGLVRGLLRSLPDAEERANSIVEALVEKYASHQANILRRTARDPIGLPVQDTPSPIWARLVDLQRAYDSDLDLEDDDWAVEAPGDPGFYRTRTVQVIQCDKCGTADFSTGAEMFCAECGASYSCECESCEEVIDPEWNFCRYCGHPLKEQPQSGADRPEPEARP